MAPKISISEVFRKPWFFTHRIVEVTDDKIAIINICVAHKEFK